MGKFKEQLRQHAESVKNIDADLQWARNSRFGALAVVGADVILTAKGVVSPLFGGLVGVSSAVAIAFESIYIPLAQEEAASRQQGSGAVQ